jgi:2-amino-1-hydroxyethylphosphonate dioxygenase (glycine-forming)
VRLAVLQHALQAAHLAARAGYDEETVLAALLHDIGHLVAAPGAETMANVGIKGHENIGADFLRRLGPRARRAALAGQLQAD